MRGCCNVPGGQGGFRENKESIAEVVTVEVVTVEVVTTLPRAFKLKKYFGVMRVAMLEETKQLLTIPALYKFIHSRPL